MTELDDPLLTETNVEGSLFDPREMERLWRETHQGLWFWNDWETAMMYRSLPLEIVLREMRKAAPIAESGREIIEQAKEEMFFAWGL
jgi:hypothetical protein